MVGLVGRSKFFQTPILFAAVAMVAASSVSLAAEVSTQSQANDLSPKSAQEWQPLLIGGWQVSPTIFAGAVYNSNVDLRTNADASWGERLIPGITAKLDNGIYKTYLYGIADFQNYNSSSVGTKTIVNAKAGIAETYAPTEGLNFRLSGDYTRESDVFGSSAFVNVNSGLSSTPAPPPGQIVVSPQVNAQPYNQFSGAFSADKRLGHSFIGLTASVVGTTFDNNTTGPTNSNETLYTVTGRVGFDITPQIYAYVDPSVNWQRYSDTTQNANGYRVTAGLGTRAEGIWKGEIYGGYQAENSDLNGTYDSPVFGLRVGYTPTQAWNFQASVDETLNSSPVVNGVTTGTGSTITSALLNVQYKGLPPDWTTSARFGYVRTAYVGISRTDNSWLAGANIRYAFWRNLGVTLDYEYVSLQSDVPLQSYNQQIITLGASYKY